MRAKDNSKAVDEYILNLPQASRIKFEQLRQLLKEVAPNATENLKWGKPILETETILFAFSCHKAHLSFVPTRQALEPFKNQLQPYVLGQDSIQFPLNQPLPVDLIREIAEYRRVAVEEHGAKWRN